MKYILLIITSILLSEITIAQNVGIGTNTPQEQLHTTGKVRHEDLKWHQPQAVYVDTNGNLYTQYKSFTSELGKDTNFASITDFACNFTTIVLSGLSTAINPSKLYVQVNITHTFVGDVHLYLQAPNGQVLTLARSNGGSGNNFTNTTFADFASTNISAGSAPFNGLYKPNGTSTQPQACQTTATVVTSFSGFGSGSINPNGTWYLWVYDAATGDNGTLDNWSIGIDSTIVSPTNEVWQSNGNNISNINTGNIGIGTITPTSKLDINGQVIIEQKNFGGYGGLLLKGNVPGSNYPNIGFSIKNNANTDVVAAMVQGELDNATTSNESIGLGFYTSAAGISGIGQRMYISPNGNIGISSNNPTTAKLVVGGSGGQEGIDLATSDQYANMRVLRNSLSGIDKDIYIGLGSGANSSLHLFSNNNETVSVKNENVGIGLNNPSYKLHLGYSTNGIRIEGPATAGGTALSIGGLGDVFIDKPSFVGGRLTIKENGNVGLGTNTPNHPLSFPNTLGEKISFYDNGTNNYGIGVQGSTFQIHGAVPTDDVAIGTGSSTAFTEKFRFNGEGSFAVNGNMGTPGQVLTSNGAGSSPVWENPISYNQSGAVTNLALTGSWTTAVPLTAATINLSLSRPSKVILTYKVTTEKPCALGVCGTTWNLKCKLNGSDFNFYHIQAQSQAGSPAFFKLDDRSLGPDILTLGAGSHTITFEAFNEFNNAEIQLFIAYYQIIPQ